MKIKNFVLALAVSIAAFTFVGCDDEEAPVTPTNLPSNSLVKVVHASPDAPGVDLLVDNTVAGTNLTFPNNTGYLTVNSGTRNIKVNVTGTMSTVIEANVDFMQNKNYSVFAVNSVSNIEPLLIEDDLTAPAQGKAHVRFIHLSPDAPAVDITLTDGTVVFGNKSFKEFTAFTPLDAGSYDLQVRVAGTTTVALDLPGITLEAGKIYTVFAKGFLSGVGQQELGAEIIVNNQN
ncbi:MAG: DUF4397 domain-containing protein [Ignavibacteriaceae bacterium]|nr:DUF4397 domain-containing protein [Ignavibacteriaceae bacterium]